MQDDYEDRQDREDRSGQQDRDQRPRDKMTAPPFENGHPPIIITDTALSGDPHDPEELSAADSKEDVLVGFDGTDMPNEHYFPDGSGLVFTGGGLYRIHFVTVETEDGEHTCLEEPTNCIIRVTDKRRDNPAEAEIEIDASIDGEIVVRFPGDYYNATTGNRKKMRSGLKKLKRLRIFAADGVTLLHDCPAVRQSKDCLISICDNCG